MKKRILVLFCALLCLVSACSNDSEGKQGNKTVDNVKVSDAYFGLAYYQNGPLCPVTENTNINRLLCEAMYEGLFEIGENFTAVPVLCEEYTGDGTEFVFTLKEDVSFWTGEGLTAADVVESYMTAKNTETSPYYNRMTEVSSIDAVDSKTVKITLSSPNINFPRLLDIPIFKAGTAGETFAVGTGAFKPEQNGTAWHLVKNETWNGGFLGSIRDITLVSMVRADAALSSFQTGDVSLLKESRISADSVAIGGSVDVIQTPSASLHYLGINYNNETLKDANIRKAMSAALARQNICDTQLQTFADAAILPVNPQPTDEKLQLNMQADTEKAIKLLKGTEETDADAQSQDENGDDGDDESAEAGEISITLLVNENNAFKTAAVDQIAACWQAIGITVNVAKVDFETYLARLESGDFDVYYGETMLTSDFDLRPLLSANGSLNYGNYANENMSAAIAEARQGQNVSALYEKFLEEMPIIPIAFEREQVVLRKGLIDNFAPMPYNAFADLENWTSEN